MINKKYNRVPDNFKTKLFSLLGMKKLVPVPRLFDNIRAETTPHRELKRFVCGEQHYGTKSFFQKEFGQYHTITLEQFPQYIFLKEHLDDPFKDHIYMRYLKANWEFKNAQTNTNERRIEKIKSFIALYHEIDNRSKKGQRPFLKPIFACSRPDGKWILIRGHHRAAIALKLNIDLRVRFIDPKIFLSEIAAKFSPKIPEISIFDQKRELVVGQHRDVADVINSMNRQDIQGKTILDLGCNIGSRCFLAAMFGAKNVIGVDNHLGIVSCAVRLNSYFALPVDFIAGDLNEEIVDMESADTVFCFSLAEKIKNREHFIQTVLDKTKQVLYFELPSSDVFKDYQKLLNNQNFSSIEQIHVASSITGVNRRPNIIYRCAV